MSLLTQLTHDSMALNLGGPEHVLHLFQCQECFGYDAGAGNDAIMVPVKDLDHGLTQLPAGEALGGVLGSSLDAMVGELWIDGWKEQDDGLAPGLAKELFDQDKWMQLPRTMVYSMFESRWRTKMGGVPYWTGNGPLHKPRRGYEFLFQIDNDIEFQGKPPRPNDVGGMVVVTKLEGQGSELRVVRQDYRKPRPSKKRLNAPWIIQVDESEKGKFLVGITNLGTDGTAYVFINRRSNPAEVYWFWNR